MKKILITTIVLLGIWGSANAYTMKNIGNAGDDCIVFELVCENGDYAGQGITCGNMKEVLEHMKVVAQDYGCEE